MLVTVLLLGGCASSAGTQTNTSSQQSVSSSAAVVWHTYMNPRMGFSMQLPDKAYAGGTNGLSPVVALDDPKTGDVYVTLQYFYDQNIDQPADEKNKKDLTVDFLKTNPSITAIYWHIQSVTLDTNQQIDQWIKKTFGKGCSLGTQTPTDQSGVMDLAIQGDGKGLDTTDCPVNYGVFMRYSSAKHQLIYWLSLIHI